MAVRRPPSDRLKVAALRSLPSLRGCPQARRPGSEMLNRYKCVIVEEVIVELVIYLKKSPSPIKTIPNQSTGSWSPSKKEIQIGAKNYPPRELVWPSTVHRLTVLRWRLADLCPRSGAVRKLDYPGSEMLSRYNCVMVIVEERNFVLICSAIENHHQISPINLRGLGHHPRRKYKLVQKFSSSRVRLAVHRLPSDRLKVAARRSRPSLRAVRKLDDPDQKC